MNCNDCQNQFSDFFDAEISLKLARNVENHLAECPSCSAEWQLFQQTVTTLHSFPVQKVPAGFIVGIHDKLEPQPFAKLRGWLSFMAQHKMHATTALATLMVGVISAAVLQLSPLDSEQILARKDSAQNSSNQTVTVAEDHTNYYPGIPYLAQNSATRQITPPRARVQFTPVKQSAPKSGHTTLLDSRGPPNLSHSALRQPSLPHLGTTAPDLVVTVHASSTAYQHALIRQLTSHRNWQTQISGNSLLVTLPCSQLANFQHLFGPVDPHINPAELSRLSKSPPSSLLTVAVAFH